MLLYTRNLTSKVPVHIFLLENIVKLRFWGPSEAEGPQHEALHRKTSNRVSFHKIKSGIQEENSMV
jgi:hypothetical protein